MAIRPSVVLLVFLSISSTAARAARLVIQNPCADQQWLDVEADAKLGDSVGAATVATLEQNGLPYVGSASGINSIKGTVTGDAALEILSDREMRAYGWCFSVDGVFPDRLADDVRIEKPDAVIRWVFGFAHYLDGKWVSMCTPTHRVRPPYVCGHGWE